MDGDALKSICGVEMPTYSLLKGKKEFSNEMAILPSKIKKGKIHTQKGFLSTSGVFDMNVMQKKDLVLKIKVPAETNCYISTNYKESEIIFGQNTKLEIQKSEITNLGESNCKLILECIINVIGWKKIKKNKIT